jgi:hypothetical protein
VAGLMGASIVLSTLVGVWLGVKLVLMSKRSGEWPEFYIGTGLLMYAGVAQVGMLLAHIIGKEQPFAVLMTLALIRILAFVATLLCFTIFTWTVFGIESPVRRAMAALVSGLALVGALLLTYAIWIQLGGGERLPGYYRLGLNVSFVVQFLWMGIESLRYYSLMNRRLALGLAEPVVVNRFFVWGIGAVLSGLCVLGLFVASLLGHGLADGSVWSEGLVTFAGLLNAVIWWISLAPPAFYTRWISATSPEGAAHG